MIKNYINHINFKSLIIQLLFLYIGIVYFSIAISNILLGIVVFVFIVGLIFNKIPLNLNKQNTYLFIFTIIPLLLTLFSTFNSLNFTKGLDYLWLRLPILIIPFIIIFINFRDDNIKNGLKYFTVLTIIATLITFYKVYLYLGEGVLLVPEFTFLIMLIQHPYFGIFSLIAIVSLIEFNLIESKFLKIIFIVILIAGIILSTSRIVYLSLFSIIVYYLFKRLNLKYALYGVITITFIFIFFIGNNKNIALKFQTSLHYENSPRLQLWNNAYKVITSSDNVLLGVGIGDFYTNKKDPYFFKGSKNGIQGYNPHNQFIEFIITNGIIGFVILLFYLFFGIKVLRKQNSYAIIIFIVILFFSLTESILSRQYGVQLYSVFIPLILKENFKK